MTAPTIRQRIVDLCARPGGATKLEIATALGIQYAHAHTCLRSLRDQRRVAPGHLSGGERLWHTPDTLPDDVPPDDGAKLPGKGGTIIPGSHQDKVLKAIAAAGDAGITRSDVCKKCGMQPAQLRRLIRKIVGSRAWEAPEPGTNSPRMFATPEAAAKWRRVQTAAGVTLSAAEKKALTIKVKRKAGTDAAKAAGLAAPVTLRHDMRKKVGDGQAIYTGRERVTVAKHQPDPRFYVDPATMPRLFSALPIGRYLEA